MNWRQLSEAAARGDRASARTLYDAASGLVFRHCLLSTRGDRDAAKDLAQEVWTRVFRQLGQLQQPEAFVSWALSIATSLCRSRGRLDQRRGELLEAFACEAALDGPPESEGEVLRREALVRESLAAIDDETQRALATAVYVRGQTTREAAASLGVPHGTVTVTLMRLRQALRARLLRQLAEEGFA